ncbi:ATP-dependent helicase [Psychrobacillus sp. FSL H8-0484]|uniref:ATP-dependent helicase n=1 Tax=Psychrobacillus sp. FSL H8-0484 TaxID=2921390 RepID=UPI0030F86753
MMNLFANSFTYPVGSKKKTKIAAPIAAPLTTEDLVMDSEVDAPFFRSLEKEGIYLNQEQLQAVRSLEGPHLLVAGAGAGKTRVLTARASYILTYQKEVEPNQILLLTFTKKAANEMIERMKKMPHLSEETVDKIDSGTFHSFLLRLLRENGYRQRILSSDRYRQIILKDILKSLKLHELYAAETVLATISHWKSQMMQPDHIELSNRTEKELAACYLAYEEWKQENDYLDFDDILLETYDLFLKAPGYAAALRDQYRYISIDEFQDTNRIQDAIMKILTHDTSNVIFVGDPDQLIYSFNSCSNDFILNLQDFYPTLKTITLTTNYRSNQLIVGAANKVISFNKNRIDKSSDVIGEVEDAIWYSRPADTEEEASWITSHLMEEQKRRVLNDFAILYRTHSTSRAIVDELVYKEIPFIIYGNDTLFYENGFIVPLLAHLRLLVNEDDLEAIAEMAPTCYVSRDVAYQNAKDYAELNPDKPAIFSLLQLQVSEFQKRQIVNRLSLLKQLKTKKPREVIQHLRKAFYNKHVEAREREVDTMQKEYVQEILNEFEASSKRFDTTHEYILFIDRIISIYHGMEELRKDPNAEAVQLMSIHQAKGLEFPTVFLIGASEGIMPHASATNADQQKDRVTGTTSLEAIEEERRLLYVGMTRAENELFISSPRRYHDKEVDTCHFLLQTYS